MTDAAFTVRGAIFTGIIDQWHKKNDPKFAQIMRDNIFEKLFSLEYRDAIEEYLSELNKTTKEG